MRAAAASWRTLATALGVDVGTVRRAYERRPNGRERDRSGIALNENWCGEELQLRHDKKQIAPVVDPGTRRSSYG